MSASHQSPHIHFRACHLCEATCGLEIHTLGNDIIAIKGDKEDPLSQGHFCPKALALKDIQNDPDRLRQPVRRNGDSWQTIEWDEAFDTVVDRLLELRESDGADSIGVYLGNPCVHNYGMLTHAGHFLSFLKTRNRFSATSLDQLPHHLVGYLMYGHQMLIPIPDIDHTDLFLIIGGNPVASNGSMMTVPNVRRRLKRLKERGGKLIVVDPRRTETAKLADEHHFIKPGTDVVFLLALLNVLFAEAGSASDALLDLCDGLEEVRAAIEPYTPEYAAPISGISADTIRRLAKELNSAEAGVCYGRMGASVQRFGTSCQWLIQLVNILAGQLDKQGGALFSKPAFDTISGPGSKPGHFAKRHSRVRHLPEFANELPAAAMAEEIMTEGTGQIKALLTAAANPVLTAQNGTRLERAFSQLDFMVSLDFYINETTRFADIILPPTFALEHDHYDIAFNVLAVRNVARYNQPLFDKPEGALHDWEIYTELGKRMAARLGLDPKPENSPDQMLDFMLQTGPYSSHAGSEHRLSLEMLKQHPHGLDLGPLQPSLPERLCTSDKRIQCAPPVLMADIPRVKSELGTADQQKDELLLIGRRHLFDANSWLHNFPRLLGKDRCYLMLHPDDAARRAIKEGDTVRVSSATGSVDVPVKITDEVMPGVTCLPHGWGHHRSGVKLGVATEHPGVSMNDLTDDSLIDAVSGNAVLNGIPVSVSQSD